METSAFIRGGNLSFGASLAKENGTADKRR